MEASVTMSAQELVEFMEWRKRKSVNSLACSQYISQLQALAAQVLLTVVDRGSGDSSVYGISSQGCAENLVAMAMDLSV